MTILHNINQLKDRRRNLRQTETKEEKILWAQLRNNRLGYKFKRQHSIGGYIVDFFCSEYRLIIEVDGLTHSRPDVKEYDETRDDYFKELGCTTIRFSNAEVERNTEKVLTTIKNFLDFSPLRTKDFNAIV